MRKDKLHEALIQVRALLPKHYTVTWGTSRKKPTDKITHEYFHCVSPKGIEVEEIWRSVFAGFKELFGKKFLEVYHETCTNHIDFYIYFKPISKQVINIVPPYDIY